MAGRSDALRQPLRQRAVAGADLQAMPARRDARLQQVKFARRVEQIRHQPQPVGFAPDIMLPNIFVHDWANHFGRNGSPRRHSIIPPSARLNPAEKRFMRETKPAQ
jgi:hypothetical protein